MDNKWLDAGIIVPVKHHYRAREFVASAFLSNQRVADRIGAYFRSGCMIDEGLHRSQRRHKTCGLHSRRRLPIPPRFHSPCVQTNPPCIDSTRFTATAVLNVREPRRTDRGVQHAGAAIYEYVRNFECGRDLRSMIARRSTRNATDSGCCAGVVYLVNSTSCSLTSPPYTRATVHCPNCPLFTGVRAGLSHGTIRMVGRHSCTSVPFELHPILRSVGA